MIANNKSNNVCLRYFCSIFYQLSRNLFDFFVCIVLKYPLYFDTIRTKSIKLSELALLRLNILWLRPNIVYINIKIYAKTYEREWILRRMSISTCERSGTTEKKQKKKRNTEHDNWNKVISANSTLTVTRRNYAQACLKVWRLHTLETLIFRVIPIYSNRHLTIHTAPIPGRRKLDVPL